MPRDIKNQETSSNVELNHVPIILAIPSKRRDRLYIIAEILGLAEHGILKTQAMYRANLSFTQVNEYLDFMLKRELLEKKSIDNKNFYVATSKGKKLYEMYYEINKMIGPDYVNTLYNKDEKTFLRK